MDPARRTSLTTKNQVTSPNDKTQVTREQNILPSDILGLAVLDEQIDAVLEEQRPPENRHPPETTKEPVKSAAWFPEALKSGLKKYAWRPPALIGGLIIGIIGLPFAAVGGIMMAAGFKDRARIANKQEEHMWRKGVLNEIKDQMSNGTAFKTIIEKKRPELLYQNTKQSRVQLKELALVEKHLAGITSEPEQKAFIKREFEHVLNKGRLTNRAMYLVLPLIAAAGILKKTFE